MLSKLSGNSAETDGMLRKCSTKKKKRKQNQEKVISTAVMDHAVMAVVVVTQNDKTAPFTNLRNGFGEAINVDPFSFIVICKKLAFHIVGRSHVFNDNRVML